MDGRELKSSQDYGRNEGAPSSEGARFLFEQQGTAKSFRLLRLKFSDYRCFPHLTIEFHPRLTVFHGINGRGKSTIAESIARLMSWFVSGFWGKEGVGMGLAESDIRVSGEKSDEVADGTEVVAAFAWDNAVIEVQLGKSGRNVCLTKRNNVQDFCKLGAVHRVFNAESRINCPLLLYFSAHRGALYARSASTQVMEVRAKRHLRDAYGAVAYEDALADDKDLRGLVAWLTAACKRKKSEGTEAQSAARQVAVLTQVLKTFWTEVDGIELDQSTGFGRLLISIQGQKLSVDQLSDGQRHLFFLLGEIVWRLVVLNPCRKDPMQGSGIVVIDDVEHHLHPQWQVQIIDCLLAAFPRLQFIITTHSPQVISCVPKECLYQLPDHPRAVEVLLPSSVQTRGRSSNEVLEMVMGTLTPPEQVESGRWIECCRHAMADHRWDEAAGLLNRIKAHFGANSEEAVLLSRWLELFKQRDQKGAAA